MLKNELKIPEENQVLENSEEKKESRKTIFIIILLLLLIVLGGVSGYLYFNRNIINEASGRGIDLSAENYSGGQSKGVAIPCFAEINLKAGETKVAVKLKNPKENKEIANLQYSLELEETGETLYTSGLIEPGKQVKNIELSRPLEEGEYKAIFHVLPFSTDEGSEQLNSLDSELTLKVY